MSENSSGTGLNWRGPLLATGIFAVLFAILLLIAHENRSDESDMGSSFREDPYGTSLLFDSYERAGYEVKHSQDEDSLTEQNALQTTAFFIGGFSANDWKMEKGKFRVGEKFRERIEGFLAQGGRVVLVAPAWKLRSESQGWEVENKWSKTANESKPIWISPDPNSMPAGSEKMYLSDDAPWLKTDPAWTALYAKPLEANTESDSSVHVYMAKRQVGNGELIAASQESFLLNEAIKAHPGPALLDFLTAGRPVVWVDETLHGLRQDEGVLWLVHRYRLQAALLLFWATLFALLWSISGDLVRRPIRNPEAQLMRNSESAGVAAQRLLERSVAKEQVLAECWNEFCRRSPQDAQAIAQGPKSGPRLRAAMEQPLLSGYRQLSQLVGERRASVKGLAFPDRKAPDHSRTAPKNG